MKTKSPRVCTSCSDTQRAIRESTKGWKWLNIMSNIGALANSVANKPCMPLILLYYNTLQWQNAKTEWMIPLCSYWTFIFPIQESHFSPLLSTAVFLLAAPLWCSLDLHWGIYRQRIERPAGCSALHSLEEEEEKKGLMQVWCPPPDLPECEWTSVNRRQTYTNAPAAIGL